MIRPMKLTIAYSSFRKSKLSIEYFHNSILGFCMWSNVDWYSNEVSEDVLNGFHIKLKSRHNFMTMFEGK